MKLELSGVATCSVTVGEQNTDREAQADLAEQVEFYRWARLFVTLSILLSFITRRPRAEETWGV